MNVKVFLGPGAKDPAKRAATAATGTAVGDTLEMNGLCNTRTGTVLVDAGTATTYTIRIEGRYHDDADWVTIASPTANTEGAYECPLCPQMRANIVSSNGTIKSLALVYTN